MKKQDIINRILAAARPKLQAAELAPYLLEAREVNQGPTSGIFKSRKTEHAVQYESHLERDVMEILEDMTPVVWFNSQRIEFSYQNSEPGNVYTPDIICRLSGNQVLVIEAKPLRNVCDHMNYRKYLAALDRCRRNNWHYLILSSKHGSIDDMSSTQVAPAVEKDFVRTVKEKYIDKFRGIKPIPIIEEFNEKYDGFTEQQAIAIALRNDLTCYRKPDVWAPLPQDWSWKNVMRIKSD